MRGGLKTDGMHDLAKRIEERLCHAIGARRIVHGIGAMLDWHG